MLIQVEYILLFFTKLFKGSISLELEAMNNNTNQVSASYLLFQQNNLQINEVTKNEVKINNLFLYSHKP